MSASGPLHDLGVRADAEGGRIRIWSEHATSIELVVFADGDLDWAVERTPLRRDSHGVWEGASARLVPGARYGLRVDGPPGIEHAFNPVHTLLDPYARGLAAAADGSWRGVAMRSLADDGFDWTGTRKPQVPLDRTVVYASSAVSSIGVSTHVRPSKRSARAPSTPSSSEPAMGWPAT